MRRKVLIKVSGKFLNFWDPKIFTWGYYY